ncbi:lipid A biosynthesis lauroyl acyltransferase [Methylobrevis pamukkalensis]|uniref:Lipid A biosynthesis lauroyl acyltransferase n=1 Tax=Methylobrevis pamukkalensis TaxID=1439726 RepID=A0A1E3H4M5_9HYPH|nr:hypothetical protein [Methylobrevis pamukkalensis]ODN71278.1 lipid A biosynthesis lauroyl acyltransferase [Methylobrevis pamukkalensis]
MTQPDRQETPETVPGTAPTLRERIEHAGLRLAVGILRLMSLDRASAVMGWAWRRLAPFNRRHARAQRNLASAMPDLSAAERDRILDAMWDNLGRVAAETVFLPEILAEPDRIELAVDEALFTGVDFSRGAIFVSLHTGNWELVATGVDAFGLDAAAVYRRVNNPLAESFLLSRRLPIYRAGLFSKERATPLKLRSLARAGHAICLLGDLRDRTGMILDFFGRRPRSQPFRRCWPGGSACRSLPAGWCARRAPASASRRRPSRCRAARMPRPTSPRRRGGSTPSSSAGSGNIRASGCGATASGSTDRPPPSAFRTMRPFRHCMIVARPGI